jgi:hypothetical protein
MLPGVSCSSLLCYMNTTGYAIYLSLKRNVSPVSGDFLFSILFCSRQTREHCSCSLEEEKKQNKTKNYHDDYSFVRKILFCFFFFSHRHRYSTWTHNEPTSILDSQGKSSSMALSHIHNHFID